MRPDDQGLPVAKQANGMSDNNKEGKLIGWSGSAYPGRRGSRDDNDATRWPWATFFRPVGAVDNGTSVNSNNVN